MDDLPTNIARFATRGFTARETVSLLGIYESCNYLNCASYTYVLFNSHHHCICIICNWQRIFAMSFQVPTVLERFTAGSLKRGFTSLVALISQTHLWMPILHNSCNLYATTPIPHLRHHHNHHHHHLHQRVAKSRQ